MEIIFLNQDHRLRNGWWMLIFMAIMVACILGFRGLIPVLHRVGVQSGDWIEVVIFLS